MKYTAVTDLSCWELNDRQYDHNKETCTNFIPYYLLYFVNFDREKRETLGMLLGSQAMLLKNWNPN